MKERGGKGRYLEHPRESVDTDHMKRPEDPPNRLVLRPPLRPGKAPTLCARCRLDCRDRQCPEFLLERAKAFDSRGLGSDQAAYLRREAEIRREQLQAEQEDRPCRECGGECADDDCPEHLELQAEYFDRSHVWPGGVHKQPRMPAKAAAVRAWAATRRAELRARPRTRGRRGGV